MRRLVNKQLGEPILDMCCFEANGNQYTAPTNMIVGNENYKEYASEHGIESYSLPTLELPNDVNVLVLVGSVWFDEMPPYTGEFAVEYYFPNVGNDRDLSYDYRVYSAKKGSRWSGETVSLYLESYEEDPWHELTYFGVWIAGEDIGEDDNGKRIRVYFVGDEYYAQNGL